VFWSEVTEFIRVKSVSRSKREGRKGERIEGEKRESGQCLLIGTLGHIIHSIC